MLDVGWRRALTRRADLPGRKSNSEVAIFDPEPLFAILVHVDSDNHAASAGFAPGDTEGRNLRVLALRPPVFHEFLERVIRAGLGFRTTPQAIRSEEHTSELQSLTNLVCRLLLEKKKK